MFAFSSPADAFDAAMAQQAAKNFPAAAALWQQLLHNFGENPVALYHLGVCYLYQNRFSDAQQAFRHALRLAPDAETYCALGSALKGDNTAALEAFQTAIRLDPNLTAAHFNCGNTLVQMQRPAEAEQAFRTVLAQNPRHLGAHNNLGNVLMVQDRPEEAIAVFQAALRLNPHYPKTYFNLGCASARANCHEDAIALFEKALALDPGYVRAREKMGTSLNALGRTKEAADAFHQALQQQPDLASARFGLGTSHQLEGDFAAAHQDIRKALALSPRPFFWNALVMTKTFTDPSDPDIAAIKALKDSDTLPDSERARIFFMLGKIYNDLGRYPDAFAAWQAGNQRMQAQLKYDPAQDLAMMQQLAEIFSPDFLARRKAAGPSSQQPVFIVGMPRAGTSLVEQILASHTDVFGAGELNDFSVLFARKICGGSPRLSPENLSPEALRDLGQSYLAALNAHAPGARRITDKMPGNFAYAGLIRLALPGAKILHVHRDPRDCCLSCYSKQFLQPQPFSYDLIGLGRYYRGYEQLMAHWRKVLPPESFMDVAYEDLVEDFEPQVKRLLTFCGLDWQESCRDFYKTKRLVRTASQAQVRQPLFHRSIGRWRAYEKPLAPLIRVLNES